MNTANNILLVRIPAQEVVNSRELRDYILESLAQGVLVLTEDASCEVMNLPPLGGVKIEAALEMSDEPEPPEPEPDDEPMNVELHGGRGAKEKKAIQDRLIAYRKKHGLGCWKKVAAASNGRLFEEDLRGMFEGKIFSLASWRVANMALDNLEGKSNDPDRA